MRSLINLEHIPKTVLKKITMKNFVFFVTIILASLAAAVRGK